MTKFIYINNNQELGCLIEYLDHVLVDIECIYCRLPLRETLNGDYNPSLGCPSMKNDSIYHRWAKRKKFRFNKDKNI